MNVNVNQGLMRIGEHRVDRAACRLWRNGQPIDVVPQAWALLMCLIERPGEVVTKDEILAAAWPGVAVSDMALSQAVRRLRTALGDDARAPRYIETVHRRGFRFIASPYPADSTPLVAAEDAALFVGRDAERRQLNERLALAHGGARQIVFVEGDPGIGKTALVNAFLAEHAGDGSMVVRAQCVQQGGSVEPYLAVLEALDHLLRGEPAAIDALRRYAPTWLAQIPWLLSPEEARDLEDSAGDATHARMLREMARALEVVAGERPVVVVLEDLHWADTATIDLLGSVAQRTEPARLLVVCIYQPARAIACGHPIVDVARRLWARDACTRLSLEMFTPADVKAFLAQRLSSPDLAKSLAGRFHARSEGNPLFLASIVDHLLERGIVVAGASGTDLIDKVRDQDLCDIPPNLRGMIELQLDSVGMAELEVLEAASAAALEFRTASVATALGDSGPEGVEAVEYRCERLVERWHLLREAGAETWPDGSRTSRYAFRHELYRQVLYERLPEARRRRFHQRIGERLEQVYAGNSSRMAAELAAHFDRSGDSARAAAHFIQAARQARRRFAEHEAASHFGAALRHLEDLPPDAGRDLQELQARLGLVRARLMTEPQRPEEEQGNLSRIESLAACITQGPDFFRLQLTLAQIHVLRSLPALAEPITDRLVELAEHGDPAQQMEAYLARGSVAIMQGRFAAGAEDTTRAHQLYGDGDPPAAASFPGFQHRWREVGTRIHGNLGMALLLLGAPEQAMFHLRQTIDLCEGRLHPNYVAGRLLSVAGVLCLRGDLELAQAVSDRGLAIATEHQFASMIDIVAPQRLWLAFTRGDREDAGERIRNAWEDYLRARDSSAAPAAPLFLLDACCMASLPDEGLAMAERVWDDTRPTGLRWYDAELQRLKGELILLRGSRGARPQAAACFQQARQIARQQGARLYERRAASSLAQLDHGPREGARSGGALSAAKNAP